MVIGWLNSSFDYKFSIVGALNATSSKPNVLTKLARCKDKISLLECVVNSLGYQQINRKVSSIVENLLRKIFSVLLTIALC
jgi:hypothetical protein